MRLIVILRLLAVVLLLLVAVPSHALVTCSSGCAPWSVGTPCERRGRLMLRMGLDLSRENYWGTSHWENASYAFCLIVDRFQLLNLNYTALYTAGAANRTADPPQFRLTSSLPPGSPPHYLSVYGFGFGNTSTRLWPPKGNSTGAVELATNGVGPCPGPDYVAVVNILVLEVGLHKGLFNYIGAIPELITNVTNPFYNATQCAAGNVTACTEFIINTTAAVAGVPAKTGFSPTCKYNEVEGKDVCMFNANSPCVGMIQGQRNCGACYGSGADDIARMASASTQIFVSYYGTDKRGRALTSGGLNPMNYLSFSGGVFTTISERLQNIWSNNDRNASDIFNNPNFPWN